MDGSNEAVVGDEIVVDGGHVGDLARKGEVLEVLRTGGVVHYRVLWDDGTDCIFFPGPDAHVVHLRGVSEVNTNDPSSV